MTYVVTESCIRCKYTDCVEVCPANAIYAADDVAADQQDFTPLNAELARLRKPITKATNALPDADAWASVKAKKRSSGAVSWRSVENAAVDDDADSDSCTVRPRTDTCRRSIHQEEPDDKRLSPRRELTCQPRIRVRWRLGTG